MTVAPGLCLPPAPRARGRRISLLARRTIERRAPVLHDAPDGAWTTGRAALFAFAVVDTEAMLEHAEPAVGEFVIAQRRAAGFDRVVENNLDALDQAFGTFVRCACFRGDGRRQALWRQRRAMQRLADIDVAEAGDDALVEQGRLETC